MKEELISFKTSKLAKEKGFDWETHHYYSKDKYDKTYSEYHGYNDDYWGENWFYNWNINGEPFKPFSKDCYSRPTQSLLQKWLEEMHFKYVKCNPVYIYKDKKIQWEYVIFFLDQPLLSGSDGFKNRMSLLDYPYYWDTHKEALEKGLLEGLKLIK